MNKKIISLVTLIAFAIFTWSCSYKIKQVEVETVQKKGTQHFKIVGVLTKTGEKIDFVKKSPIIIIDDAITGEAVSYKGDKKSVSIPISEVSVVLVKKAKVNVDTIFLVSILVGLVAFFLVIPRIVESGE